MQSPQCPTDLPNPISDTSHPSSYRTPANNMLRGKGKGPTLNQHTKQAHITGGGPCSLRFSVRRLAPCLSGEGVMVLDGRSCTESWQFVESICLIWLPKSSGEGSVQRSNASLERIFNDATPWDSPMPLISMNPIALACWLEASLLQILPLPGIPKVQ